MRDHGAFSLSQTAIPLRLRGLRDSGQVDVEKTQQKDQLPLRMNLVPSFGRKGPRAGTYSVSILRHKKRPFRQELELELVHHPPSFWVSDNPRGIHAWYIRRTVPSVSFPSPIRHSPLFHFPCNFFTLYLLLFNMRMPEVVWESVSFPILRFDICICKSNLQSSYLQYHSDGRPRNTPLPSTVHGWLTKMRGTLLDNEPMRRQGIKEMKQATAVRIHRQKEEANRKIQDLARAKAGRSPLRPSVKQPWLRLSFLRNRPQPIPRGSGRPTVTTRKSSSSHTHKRKPHSASSRPRHTSTSGNRNSKRTHAQRKTGHAKRTAKK